MNVAGWASRKERDRVGHIVMPNAFDASIREKGVKGPKSVKFLFQHKPEQVIGRITKLQPRNSGVWLEGWIDENITAASDVAEMIRAVDGLSFSVGFFLIDVDIDEDEFGRESLVILKAELEEVSVVTIPAHPDAVIEEWKEDKQ